MHRVAYTISVSKIYDNKILRSREEKWKKGLGGVKQKYTIVSFFSIYEVLLYNAKEDYEKLRIYIINLKRTTKIKKKKDLQLIIQQRTENALKKLINPKEGRKRNMKKRWDKWKTNSKIQNCKEKYTNQRFQYSFLNSSLTKKTDNH